MQNSKTYGHSADVRIHLHVNGEVLPISHLGPDFLILRIPVNHPPTEAEISMSIDGQESRWSVRLINGIAANERKTRIGPVPLPAPARP